MAKKMEGRLLQHPQTADRQTMGGFRRQTEEQRPQPGIEAPAIAEVAIARLVIADPVFLAITPGGICL
jgi:hypothetical protein